ncbi:hypothetical protein BCR43DRAFT_90233 [Syncephalastrum racemosum]|uniref:Uncharacterized protein n=1 Tax=Syncephalastrum racemosum TaxID=13706 RepID=A0A1X2H3J7_SYNRA|nr:hypothetical protein BCR43DRAFT_90233 [Syncephalastrum racemosum]
MNSKTAEKKSNSNSAARSANNASTDNKKIEHSTSRSPGTRRSSRRSTQMATPGKSTSIATDNEEPICCDVMPADLQRVHSSSFTEPMARTAEQEADIFSSFTMDEQDELFKHLDDFDKPDTQLPGDTTEGGLSFSCSSGNLKTELRSFKRSNPQPDSGAPPPKR